MKPNAADLEFPATDPANAPARAEFKRAASRQIITPARRAHANARDTQTVNQDSM